MNVFSRSWQITKLSFSVINKDRELLGFAFLSFFCSSLFTVAMIVPSVLPDLLSEESIGGMQAYQYALIFLTYFGLAFIATFFNVCVVYTTKVRFEGGNATFSESIRFAFTKLGLIVQWSLLSASVGLLLRVLDRLASSFGRIGQIVGGIIVGILGAAWSIATIFVVPILVYEGMGPIDAVKKSIQSVKDTWGENMVKGLGLGLMAFFSYLLVIAVGIGLAWVLSAQFDAVGLMIGIVIGGCLLLLTGLIFKVANTVFSTALYLYASERVVAADFNEDLISETFRPKKGE